MISNAEYFNSRSLNLHFIWSGLLGIGGFFIFGLFDAILKRFRTQYHGFKYLVIAPIFWLAVVEKSRSILLFDYEWMPAGSLLIELPWIAQLASIGGVWILGCLVIAFNGWLYLLIDKYLSDQRSYLTSIIFISTICLAAAWGQNRISSLNELVTEKQAFKVATIQFAKSFYTDNDFTSFYMDKYYFDFMGEMFKEHSESFDILILPESISFGSMSLDEIDSEKLTDKTLSTVQEWYLAIKPLIAPNSLLIFGAGTVEKGKDYNSILVWNNLGPIWRYNKQRLVPFAEAIPERLSWFGLTGKSTYFPGDGSKIASTNKINLGFFICQEVLFSDVINRSVTEGAEVLITVGNDGVFENPAVAKANAIAARLRAIESGRYIVRAMKSGISGVIQPTGNYRSSMGMGEKGVIFSKIFPLTHRTFYSRLHDYVGWALFIVALGLMFFEKGYNSINRLVYRN